MKNKFQLKNRKGQSAIEYLMTYGWMLLVVAIVGGAIFATVQDNQNACEQEITDIESTQQGFGVSEFTVTSNSLNVELENNQRDTVTVNSVNISQDGSTVVSGSDWNTDPSGEEVGFGDALQISTNQISQSESCGTFDISISFDQGDLPNERSGQLQGQMATS